MKKKLNLVLGSSSVWRKEIFQSWYPNEKIRTMNPDIDEYAIRDPDAEKLTVKISDAKADALIPLFTKEDKENNVILITGDQVISHKGKILEKPKNIEQAKTFLRGYHEESPYIVSGVSVVNIKTGKRSSGVESIKLEYKKIPEDILDIMLKKNQKEIFSCCGAITVEDEYQKQYISKIHGDKSCVYGLPKKIVMDLIKKLE